MQDLDPDDPRLRGRPLWGLAILLLPIIGVLITLVGYALMVGFGVRGRPATGDRQALAFTGCPEAADVVADRLRDMGLEPVPFAVPKGFGFEVVLPEDPAVAARIPTTLTTPGVFEIRGGDEVLATTADVTGASVRMDLLMIPSTLVTLRPDAAQRVVHHVRAHPEGRLAFFLDGAPIGTQGNQNPVAVGEVEIGPDGLEDQARWLAVAEWSVVVDHPLPCPIVATAPPAPPPDR